MAHPFRARKKKVPLQRTVILKTIYNFPRPMGFIQNPLKRATLLLTSDEVPVALATY